MQEEQIEHRDDINEFIKSCYNSSLNDLNDVNGVRFSPCCAAPHLCALQRLLNHAVLRQGPVHGRCAPIESDSGFLQQRLMKQSTI